MVFLFGFDIFRALSMLMVLFSDLSIGQMLAVYAYLWFMMTPVQEILGIQFSYLAAKAALARINKLMDIGLEPRYPNAEDPFAQARTTGIHVENVSFRYGDGPLVLDNVNLQIAAGEKVALVGASGGGKTTLVQILLGLYLPEQGQVYFDGVPVTRIGLDVVRDNVATVLQHPALFNDTVRNNLTLGKQSGDRELWRALDVAQLSDVVRGLPNGLDTLVGRNGIRLSGGQRQRLAVARMVLSDPRIVILDEATSALDTTTEQNLHLAMREFSAGTDDADHRPSSERGSPGGPGAGIRGRHHRGRRQSRRPDPQRRPVCQLVPPCRIQRGFLMPVIESAFRPAWWLRGDHAQTLWPAFFPSAQETAGRLGEARTR